ncbi:hypothetical protein HH310_25525 [Actinoplanes sp. TBRC 11911]|uniref:hypothetical protein n=1 Tax=Actinoplanes sp. TBRC 11911 TaxID=2729386 RepID=UPI00145E7D48|nr:hypothetical protein [Actinoplanes sp. TBRC 11911]NMO54531.1 hypothetical protein [Actinoplanes sp. TBRC 11911]
MSGEYDPLTAALSTAADQDQLTVEIGLDEIANLVGVLPPSCWSLATSAAVIIDDHEHPPDLATKAGRLLAESAANVDARISGATRIVNLG